jgi:GT2 family glycosyltransferase
VPLVSVCIPTYNGEKYILEALDSLKFQTFNDFDVLISDDGSSDNTLNLVHNFFRRTNLEYKVLTKDMANSNIAVNCNKLVENTSSKYIKFLFQDDVLEPQNLEKLVQTAEKDTKLGLIFSKRSLSLVDKNKSVCLDIYNGCKDLHLNWSHIRDIQPGIDLLNDKKLFSSPINKIGEPSNTLILKEAFESVGGFDPQLKQLIDVDLWFKLLARYNVAFVDEELSVFRIHYNQQSVKNIQNNRIQEEILYILKKTILSDTFSKLNFSSKQYILNHTLSVKSNNYKIKVNRIIRNIIRRYYDKIYIKDNLNNELAELKESLKNILSENVYLKDKLHFVRNTFSWKIRKYFVKKYLYLGNKCKFIKENNPFLKSSSINISFNNQRDVKYSLIIPVYNQEELTLNCLNSIYQNTSSEISYEVIVINDFSSKPLESIKNIPGLRIIDNKENIGYLKSCNKASDIANGDFIVFLNNDTTVCEKWLHWIDYTFENIANVGAVGSKLIYPNGVLQEAGGIIWNDATGCNYGRGEDPLDSKYNFARIVDYCSAACLALRKDLFHSLNKFSENYAPAYYEDTDLCFKIAKLQLNVIYQPKCIVIHHEGATCGTSIDSGVKSFQEINRIKFLRKWTEHLTKKPPVISCKIKKYQHTINNKKVIVIIDSYLPIYDKESGSQRLYQIIKILLKLEYHIIFLPDNYDLCEPYYTLMQNLGIEVIASENNLNNLKKIISFDGNIIKAIWICRPNLFTKYKKLFENFNGQFIYDSIDIHHVRLLREYNLNNKSNKKLFTKYKYYKKIELISAKLADKIIAITPNEFEFFSKINKKTFIIPNIHVKSKDLNPIYETRSNILFIGGFQHTPNIDAVIYFCKEILPIIWTHDPKISFTILGSNPSRDVLNLANSRIMVTGWVKDCTSYFNSHKVFVCPLRFGAGMKGKIGQSMAYGLPVVSTCIGAEGIGLKHLHDSLITDDVTKFAEYVYKLYTDKLLWCRIHSNSLATLKRYSPEEISIKIKSLLND